MIDFETGDIISYASGKWSRPSHLGIIVDFGEVSVVTVAPWPTDQRDPLPSPTVEVVSLESIQACGGVLRLHRLYRTLYPHELERLGHVLQLAVDGRADCPEQLRSLDLVELVLSSVGVFPSHRCRTPKEFLTALETRGIVRSPKIMV